MYKKARIKPIHEAKLTTVHSHTQATMKLHCKAAQLRPGAHTLIDVRNALLCWTGKACTAKRAPAMASDTLVVAVTFAGSIRSCSKGQCSCHTLQVCTALIGQNTDAAARPSQDQHQGA